MKKNIEQKEKKHETKNLRKALSEFAGFCSHNKKNFFILNKEAEQQNKNKFIKLTSLSVFAGGTAVVAAFAAAPTPSSGFGFLVLSISSNFLFLF
jgi:hypothetical protein